VAKEGKGGKSPVMYLLIPALPGGKPMFLPVASIPKKACLSVGSIEWLPHFNICQFKKD
jgi:hypothetical protein